MTLIPGTRLGPYEILSALGAGGMGEVYRAHDTKLNRDVALKVLPDSFATDPDRLARFQREAQVLASLNHPNIAHIHGLEESGGVRALVMELVEGEDLAQRIARGAIPIDEALPIAKQIAEALEAAHEQGIIHRDLKPANIKVRADGTVKVLDFGLAKALAPAAASDAAAALANSPTITTPAMTQAGMILGTAAYMSPEQAKGRPPDKRGDVWAFGCVLYEMLAGRRAFEGGDLLDTLAAVMKSAPDWTALPPSVPYAIHALLEGCLKKERKERIGDISTALFLLNQPHAIAYTTVERSPLPLWRRVLPTVAGMAIVAIVAVAVLWRPQPTPSTALTRFAITLPEGQQFASPRQALTISPDGKQIVYAAQDRLYQRSMTEIEPQAIPGTDGAVGPAFSPDGRWVLFWSTTDKTLKKIPAGGGTPSTICPIDSAPSGITWDNDGILFAEAGVGIMRVSANGGKPDVVIRVDPSETKSLVQSPQPLPGGFVLFTIARRTETDFGWDQAQIVVQSLKTSERRTVIERGADARYVPTGHLVYAVGGTLFAVPFDTATLAVTGGSAPILEGIERATSVSAGTAHFAFSNSGSMVYLPGAVSTGRQDVVLFDRTGGAQALNLPPGSYAYPRVSPDGKRLALETRDGNEMNISIYELSGATSVRRLTFGGNNRYPVWSADGRRVAFQSDREGDAAVYWQSADGGTAERLTKPDPGTTHLPESWSPAGDTFLFSATKQSEISLWTFSIHDRKATRFDGVKSTLFSTDASFSPDGHWVAYQVGEPGQGEATTYVQPFPPNDTKYQIGRGGRPLWSRDGNELFYVPAPGRFVAVKIATRPTFTFSNPVSVPRGFGVADPVNPRPYDAMPDGRIVAVGTPGQARSRTAQIDVVLNWFEDLKARVPTK